MSLAFRFLLFVLLALAPVKHARAAGKVVADVPMLFRGTSPAVHVMVNGRGPYLYLIDTGGQGQARADASLVRELGLATVGQDLSGDGSGRNNRQLDRVIFDRLSVGGLEFRQVPALSRDYNRSATLPPIAGILGYNLFENHLLTLDFIGKRVRIARGALPPADGKTILDYEAPYDTPIVEMTMGGYRLAADIDSGDTNAITFPQALAQSLPRIGEPRVVGTGRTISNEFQVSEVQLRGNLRVGEHELANPTVRFNEIHDNINLGAGFLANYTVTFDQRNRRVRIVGRPE
ncbi:MAG TPA: retropepsin-like aspartic protease [Allosphingosinicella sp.]